MSGYGERRTATTSGDSCEDWYGLGDKRCPSSYAPTGDLMTDIELIQEQLAHYRYIVNNKQVRSYWFVYFTNLLQEKQGEKSKILAQEQAKETTLPSIYGGQFVPPPQIQLSSEIQKIINDWHDHNLILPSWFANNNINWVITGHITEAEFLSGFNNLLNSGVVYYIQPPITPPITPPVTPPVTPPALLLSANIKISFTDPNIGGFSSSIPINDISELQILSNSAPEWKYTLIDSSTNQPISSLSELINNINDLLTTVEPEPDITITDNMITQQVINFNIVNGRAVGSIKFVATNNFNPYYYGQDLVNIIQFKDPNGAYIKSITKPLKENRLNFTETERDEVISYDEDMQGNTRATVESFVWPSATTPRAFSKTGSWDISEKEQPKPLTTGFMSAGAAGAIAGLVLLGFIIDSKVSKR